MVEEIRTLYVSVFGTKRLMKPSESLKHRDRIIQTVRSRKSTMVGCGALLVFIPFIVLYPFKVKVVPVWTIQVVDKSGRPVPNMPVGQDWRHYSFEQERHWEESITDENGYVTFPERVLRASVGRRLVNLRPANLPGFPHAAWGPHSS